MGSAVLHPAPPPASPVPHEPTPAPASAEALRQQAAARIAAHRDRRSQIGRVPGRAAQDVSAESATADASPKSRIAAAVAERYAQAQTYRAFLAAEAERAIQQARAAAEVAARNAAAIAEAQQQLLDSLAAQAAAETSAAAAAEAALHNTSAAPNTAAETPALWPDLHPEPATRSRREPRAREASTHDLAQAAISKAPPEPQPAPEPGLRVAFYRQIPAAPTQLHRAKGTAPILAHRPDPSDPEAWLLDEEISFRQAPVFEEPPGPPEALPANLIEFPRQLIASRKARPRYAEGPLRDEESATGRPQLRIFEVEPGQISTSPDPFAAFDTDGSPLPQWTSLWLDTPAGRRTHASAAELYADPGIAPAPAESATLPLVAAVPQLYPAHWKRRALAAGIDLAITGAATATFAAAFTAVAGHLATSAWRPADLFAGAAASLHGLPILNGIATVLVATVVLGFAYQALFFVFSDATPGMRLARVGLCTFSDENPTRSAMRRRVPALALSTLLFGIGFLWALLDEDGLPWHDLISRMYPRSY